MSARFRLRANPFKGKGVMSLAEELNSEKAKSKRLSRIDQWLAELRPTLDDEDRAALDNALVNPGQSPTHLYRVLKRRGCPGGDSGFAKWVQGRREA